MLIMFLHRMEYIGTWKCFARTSGLYIDLIMSGKLSCSTFPCSFQSAFFVAFNSLIAMPSFKSLLWLAALAVTTEASPLTTRASCDTANDWANPGCANIAVIFARGTFDSG